MSKELEPKYSEEHVADVLKHEAERVKSSKHRVVYPEHLRESVRMEYEGMQRDGVTSMPVLARKYNVSLGTIFNWVHNDPFKGGHQRTETIERLKERAGYRLWDLLHQILDGADAEKIEKADLRTLMVSAGITIDKAILIDNGGAQKVRVGFEYDNIANEKRLDVIDITSQLDRNKKLLSESEESGT